MGVCRNLCYQASNCLPLHGTRIIPIRALPSGCQPGFAAISTIRKPSITPRNHAPSEEVTSIFKTSGARLLPVCLSFPPTRQVGDVAWAAVE